MTSWSLQWLPGNLMIMTRLQETNEIKLVNLLSLEGADGQILLTSDKIRLVVPVSRFMLS